MLAAVVVTVVAALAVSSTAAAPAGAGIDAQRAQVRELEAQLLDIDARAGAAAADHAQARARVAQLRRDIARTTADLAAARRGHRIALKRFEARLVALYSNEPPTVVEVLLSSGGIAGAVEAHRALEAVSANDDAIVRRFEDARRRLGAARAELVADQRESARQLTAAEARMAQLDELLASRRAVLGRAQDALASMVADSERRRAAERRAALAADAVHAERTLRAQADGAPASAAPAPVAATASPAPTPAPAAPAAAPASGGGVSEHLASIALCESGGNPRAVSPSGQYRGKYQFDVPTWQSLGGTGDPAAAPEAEQDRLAAALYAQRGAAPWPICGR